jgi:transcriptional antiterminator NusG
MAKHWYVVHTYSQFEKSVQRALLERIAREGMQEQFGQILVPVEEVVELKAGQKSISERKFFPGYVLVEMEMTDESWHLVKSTAKVTGFLGGSAMKPTPITAKEVQNIMDQMQAGVEKPRPKVLFEVGESVRVKDGPFTDFNGSVEEVNYDKNKIRVAVTIFGRSTSRAGFRSSRKGLKRGRSNWGTRSAKFADAVSQLLFPMLGRGSRLR